MVRSGKQEYILTIREFEVSKLIAKGNTDKEIAILLNISPFTIKNHRRAILRKFQAKNCTEVIYKAAKMDLI